MIKSLTGFLTLALVAFCVPTARAHDHRVPKVTLRANGDIQQGNPYHLGWTRADGEGCVSGEGFGPRQFPTALKVPVGTSKASIRLGKRHRPDKFKAQSWRVIGPNHETVGPGEEIPYELKRRVRDGRTVAWVAVFEPPEVGHYYIDAFISWRDREGCGGSQGGRWALHLEVLGP